MKVGDKIYCIKDFIEKKPIIEFKKYKKYYINIIRENLVYISKYTLEESGKLTNYGRWFSLYSGDLHINDFFISEKEMRKMKLMKLMK